MTSYGNADYSSARASGPTVGSGKASPHLGTHGAGDANQSLRRRNRPLPPGTGTPSNGQAKGTPSLTTGGSIPPRAPSPNVPTAKAGRKARLRLARVDPWSVMKLSFLLSIAAGIVVIVAVAGLWLMLEYMGV